MRYLTYASTILALGWTALAEFGLLSTNARFIVDTDGGLVFEVNRCALETTYMISNELMNLNTVRTEISLV